MSENHLFVSFWDICLKNLPEGRFMHRRITPDEAKRIIEQARESKILLCVSEEDLMAPYRKAERDNHLALCKALQAHYAITFSLDDFSSNYGDSHGPYHIINPLCCANITDKNQLLVVTCMYVWPKRSPDNDRIPPLEIDPSSVEFHLLQADDA